jgi:integrase
MALSALVGPLIGVDRNSKAIGIDLLKGSGGEDNRPALGEPTLLPIREAKGRMRLDKVRGDAELKAALKALIATMGLPSNAEDKDLSPYRHTCADSAIRRLADEAAESAWLSSELAIGVRRVKGVKRLGRRIGNWLTGDQAQELLNAVSQSTMRGRRDAALIGLLLGCGLRRSEAVNLRFDQLQLGESHWVIVDMVGKGARLRTVPVPPWCKSRIDVWLRDSRVTEGKIFRRVSKNGARQSGTR